MNYFLYYVIGMTALGALSVIAQVGKQRRPVTNGTAALTVLWCAANITGYIWILGRIG